MVHLHSAELIPRRIEEMCQKQASLPAVAWVESGAYASWGSGARGHLRHSTISYEEFGRRASSLAAALHRTGVGRGDRVLVLLPLSINALLAAVAVHRLGAILVTCRGWNESSNVTQIDVPVKCVVAPPLVYQVFGAVRAVRSAAIRIIVDGIGGQFDGELEAMSREYGSISITDVSSDDECWLSYSPRHKTSCGALAELASVIGGPAAGRSVLATSLVSALVNLADGATSVLPPVELGEPDELDGQLLLEQMRVTECSRAYLPTALIKRWVYGGARHVELLPLLEQVTLFGAPQKREITAPVDLMFPNAELRSLFGVHERWPVAEAYSRDGNLCGEPGISVGTVLPNVDVRVIRVSKPAGRRVVDSWSDWEAEPGKIGELVVYDPKRYRSYSAWESVLVGPDRRPWFRTGQAVSLDSGKRLSWHRMLRRSVRSTAASSRSLSG